MWFGDLVTMKWWNGIWLNEAFATFMEMHATDAFRPEWERWVTFGLARTAAFDTDALSSTRPIEFPVVAPVEAEGMFDILTYEKGAAVVRMLEQYLGEDEFRDGIRAYLTTHAYANTETTDLWDAIEEATGEPVRRIMDTWIFQGGFPVIDVDLVNDGRTLRLRQERFGYAGDLGEGEPEGDEVDARGRRDLGGAPDLQPVLHRGRCHHLREGAARRTDDRHRSGRARRVAAGEHRGHRFLPGAVRARPAGRARRARPTRPLPHRALRAGRRRVGGRARRRPTGPRLPPVGRVVRGRDRPVGVAAHPRRPGLTRPHRRRRCP